MTTGRESSWKPAPSGPSAWTWACWRSWSATTTGTPSRIWGPTCWATIGTPALAAANLAAHPDRPLAQALLDQRVLAGIGNVYCNELCFVSGHLPTAPVSAVADPHRLVSRARDMLWLNRLRWNRCTTGDTRAGRQLWVYGRAGQSCRRCGTGINHDASGERVTYWCPSCQR